MRVHRGSIKGVTDLRTVTCGTPHVMSRRLEHGFLPKPVLRPNNAGTPAKHHGTTKFTKGDTKNTK